MVETHAVAAQQQQNSLYKIFYIRLENDICEMQLDLAHFFFFIQSQPSITTIRERNIKSRKCASSKTCHSTKATKYCIQLFIRQIF